MMDLVLGPVLSLYSVAFYRRVARQRLGRGLAYLVYLSSLYSAAIAIAFLAFWLPAPTASWTGSRRTSPS